MSTSFNIDRRLYRNKDFRDEFLLPPKEPVPLKKRLCQKIVSACTCSKAKARKLAFNFFPFLSICSWYNWRHDLFSDLIAGLTVGIMQIPQGMAYALLAELPPVIGLYISFFPVLIYFFFGTSRQLSLGAIAVVSLMVGSVVERETLGINQGSTVENNTSSILRGGNSTDPNAFDDVVMKKIEIAATLAFIVGVIQAAMGVCRLGLVTTYMSEPLVKGFTCGAAVHVLTSQIKYILGLKIQRFSGILQVPYTYIEIFKNIDKTNVAELIISLICIVVIYLVKTQINQRFKKKLKIPIPIDLFVLIIGTVASTFGYFHARYGIRVVDEIPAGLPIPRVPSFYRSSNYFSDTIGMTVIAFGQAVSLAVLLGKKHNYDMDSSKELFAYGMSNIFGSFFSCYPASAAVSRTTVSDSAGSRSQIFSLFSCLLLLFVILFIGPLFRELPNCILSAIVVVALRNMLMQIFDLKTYWKICKVDCIIWVVTFLSVVFLHVDLGLAIGIGFSVFTVVVRSQCTPAVTVDTIPETEQYRDSQLYKTGITSRGICVVKFNAPLYFANSQMFQNRVHKATGTSPGLLRLADFTKHTQRPNRTSKEKSAENSQTNGEKNTLSDKEDKSTKSYNVLDLHHVIIDVSASHFTDFVGAKALKQVMDEYSAMEVTVFLAGVKDELHSVLEASGFLEKYESNLFLTVHDAVVVASSGNMDTDFPMKPQNGSSLSELLVKANEIDNQMPVILPTTVDMVPIPSNLEFASFKNEYRHFVI